MINYVVNINEFVSELTRRCKALGIKINIIDMKIIVTEFIKLIHEKVFEGFEIKIKNFATFNLGKSDNRKLPNGDVFEQTEVIKVKMSRNFKNK